MSEAARQKMMDPKHTFQEATPRGSGVCWKCGQPESAHDQPASKVREDVRLAEIRGANGERAACAEIVKGAAPAILAMLSEHHTDMNRPGGGGTQTLISQERFARKIADALASRIEARGGEPGG